MDSDHLIIGAGVLAIGGLGFFKVKQAMDKKSLITKLAGAASIVAKETGIPISYIVTQAAHESNYGKSGLAQKDNNLFGIKATQSWMGKKSLWVTKEFVNGKEIEVKTYFRSYASWEDSVRDWMNLIKNRYSKAYQAGQAHDTNGFFTELQKGGYATDPKYSQKLVAVYNSIKEAVA